MYVDKVSISIESLLLTEKELSSMLSRLLDDTEILFDSDSIPRFTGIPARQSYSLSAED